MTELLHIPPGEIERRSFEILTRELGARHLDEETAHIVKRVIHTTADFDFADTLCFSADAVRAGEQAILEGATIVTDTQMALAGISRRAAARFGCRLRCFMGEEAVAARAAREGTTRASAGMDEAARLEGPLIFAIGNAPTALLRLRELMEAGLVRPRLVIGVPVGFVNVEAAKERILRGDAPYIVARGRKGGSTVAAAICNALLYGCEAGRGARSESPSPI